MSDPSVTYFPVGNGDTILIRLSDQTSILLDCNITQDSCDESNEACYDVRAHLLETLRRDGAETPYVDAFALTHPDLDHCRGFTSTFYVGDPAKYSEADRKQGLIRIDEIWFTPRLFVRAEEDLCDDAKAFRKEAKRRMALYRAKDAARKKPGNRLRVIGYSDCDEMEGLEEIISVPGQSLNLINGAVKDDVAFFVHAPFKEDTDSDSGERNLTSLVLQARFDVDGESRAGLVFFGGDQGCSVWETIVDRSADETLEYDIFTAPHHCSWTFFSDEPYEEDATPSEKCLELLNKKRTGAIVVASCKPVKDDDDNPPHYAAQEEYVNIVGKKGKRFLVTGEHPSEDSPLPLVFTMSKNGPVKEAPAKSSAIASSAAIKRAIGTPQTYGS